MLLTQMLEQWRVMRAAQTHPATAKERERLHRVYLAPRIEGIEENAMTPRMVLDGVATIMEASSPHVGRKILSDLAAAYDYAAVLGQTTHNPAARLSRYLPPLHKGHRPFLPTRDFARMLREIDEHRFGSQTVRNAFWALVFTAARRQEIVLARWDEIHLPERVWVIPSARMKMKREQVIPIPSPLVEILMYQQQLGALWVFPAPHGKDAPINLSAVNQLLRARGYAHKQSIHGIRHVFSTATNESGLFDSKVIERQLDHRPRGVAGVYDKSTLIEQRRRLMDWWADRVQQWRGVD
nr:MAG TPA: Integrase [Caudoviricetes sp.]